MSFNVDALESNINEDTLLRTEFNLIGSDFVMHICNAAFNLILPLYRSILLFLNFVFKLFSGKTSY